VDIVLDDGNVLVITKETMSQPLESLFIIYTFKLKLSSSPKKTLHCSVDVAVLEINEKELHIQNSWYKNLL
jgi:hypothetical protein